MDLTLTFCATLIGFPYPQSGDIFKYDFYPYTKTNPGQALRVVQLGSQSVTD